MDTILVVLLGVFFSLDLILCEDAPKACPVIGQRIRFCEDQCSSGDFNKEQVCIGVGQMCCLVECGLRCINPSVYGVGAPQFKSHSPNYGPISGNTVVVITGNFSTILSTPTAYLKTDLQDPETAKVGDKRWIINLDSWNFTHIVLRSKYVQDDTFINLRWLIYLDYRTQNYTWSTNTKMDFTYREDPTITNLYPRRAFVSGGIALTGIGENLNSVANPVMLVHMERRQSFGTDQFFVISRYTFKSEDTYVYNETAVVGITPTINTSATNEFETGLNEEGNAVARRKRQAPTEAPSDPTDPINSETLEFFIGFELDGVERYINLSQAINDETGRLKVFQAPEIERYKETKRYNPSTENHLFIKGERLTLGATEDDYKVSLGEESCEMADLSDNAILCSPPDDEPNSASREHELKVSIGYLKFNVGRVQYERNNIQIFIIIGCVAGAVILLALVVAISVVCCRKQKTSNTK